MASVQNTLNSIVAEVGFNKHNLDNDVVRQPQLMWAATSGLAAANRLVAVKERDKANLAAELDQVFRKEAEDNAAKTTEKALDMRVRDSEQMRTLNEEIIEARYQVDLWSGLVDSLKERGRSIREAGELYRSNYFSKESISSGLNAAESAEAKDAAAASVRSEVGSRRRVMREARTA